MTVTLRCEIFPPDLDPTVDFYTRVLRFTLDRDERQTDNPYVALPWGLRDFRVLDPSGYYLGITERTPATGPR